MRNHDFVSDGFLTVIVASLLLLVLGPARHRICVNRPAAPAVTSIEPSVHRW
jgi:hypothetical protein